MVAAKPIEYRGKTYPSRRALSKALGVPLGTIQGHLYVNGHADRAGLGVTAETVQLIVKHMGYPCRVGKRDFPSVSAAAKHHGARPHRLLQNLHAGCMTWRGLPIEWHPDALEKIGRSQIFGYAVRVNGMAFPTITHAARHFGGASKSGLSWALRRGAKTWRGMAVEYVNGPPPPARPGRSVRVGGDVFPSISAAARAHGMKAEKLRQRLAAGKPTYRGLPVAFAEGEAAC